MILVDTSIWVDHLGAGDVLMTSLLNRGEVLTHRFVIGEVAMGNLRRRDTVLADMYRLPRINAATDDEVISMIKRHRLLGTGIGYIDAHLLAATMLTPDVALWTRDQRLHGQATRLGVAARLTH